MSALAAIGRDKLTLFLVARVGAAGCVDRAARRRCHGQARTRHHSRGWRAAVRAVRLPFGSSVCRGETARRIGRLCNLNNWRPSRPQGIPVYEIEWATSMISAPSSSAGNLPPRLRPACSRSNPFDEPEAVEARQATTRLLEGYRQTGKLPSALGAVDPADAAIVKHVATARPGDYLAVDAFFPGDT